MNDTQAAQNSISFYIINLMKHLKKYYSIISSVRESNHVMKTERSRLLFPSKYLKCHRDGSGVGEGRVLIACMGAFNELTIITGINLY